jgi:hypothetical protein
MFRAKSPVFRTICWITSQLWEMIGSIFLSYACYVTFSISWNFYWHPLYRLEDRFLMGGTPLNRWENFFFEFFPSLIFIVKSREWSDDRLLNFIAYFFSINMERARSTPNEIIAVKALLIDHADYIPRKKFNYSAKFRIRSKKMSVIVRHRYQCVMATSSKNTSIDVFWSFLWFPYGRGGWNESDEVHLIFFSIIKKRN